MGSCAAWALQVNEQNSPLKLGELIEGEVEYAQARSAQLQSLDLMDIAVVQIQGNHLG